MKSLGYGHENEYSLSLYVRYDLEYELSGRVSVDGGTVGRAGGGAGA